MDANTQRQVPVTDQYVPGVYRQYSTIIIFGCIMFTLLIFKIESSPSSSSNDDKDSAGSNSGSLLIFISISVTCQRYHYINVL